MNIEDFDFYEEEEIRKKTIFDNPLVKSTIQWAIQIALVILAAWLVSRGVGQSIVMQESSMNPTLEASEKILINKVIYKITSPKRGDIIAFKASTDKNASTYIKRIIGLPGETIQILDGQIFINDEVYQEEEGFSSIINGGLAETKITLGQNEYFVLGDNRNNSEDSRYGDIGNVSRSNIIGKLWFIVSPFRNMGFLKS